LVAESGKKTECFRDSGTRGMGKVEGQDTSTLGRETPPLGPWVEGENEGTAWGRGAGTNTWKRGG